MSEHLPECPMTYSCRTFGGSTYTGLHHRPMETTNEIGLVECERCCQVCLCEILRACEQRNASLYAIRALEAEMDGYERGLLAAGEAVAALTVRDYCYEDESCDVLTGALDAITALREVQP